MQKRVESLVAGVVAALQPFVETQARLVSNATQLGVTFHQYSVSAMTSRYESSGKQRSHSARSATNKALEISQKIESRNGFLI